MGLALRPRFDKLDVVGSIGYESSAGCWNIIRLKKEFINQFSQLKQKRSCFSYRMKFYDSYDGLKEVVNRMEKNKEPLPILLYIIQEKRQD